VPWRYAITGAVIAAILFEVLRKVYAIYLAHFATYSLVYGAMAAIPIFLIWIYLLWVIILFGSLISNVLTAHYFSGKLGEIDGFTHAFLWLGYLWREQQRGDCLTVKKLYNLLPGNYQVDANTLLLLLQKKNLIEKTSRNKYILSRDFSQMTLAELYETLPWKLPSYEDNKMLSEKMNKILKKANRALENVLHLSLSDIYDGL